MHALKPKFHLARHVSSRNDSTRSTCRASRDERVERIQPCCSNMVDDEQAIARLYKLGRFMLLHAQILYVLSNIIKLMYSLIN